MSDQNSKHVYFNINKKSYLVAYILLFTLFCIGAHRFYTKNTISAIIILLSTISIFVIFFIVMSIPSSVNIFAVVPIFLIIFLTIWFVVDIFLTHNNVKACNTKLAIKIGLLNENDKLK